MLHDALGLCATNEASNFASESRDVLYGDQHNIIKKIKKNQKKSRNMRKEICNRDMGLPEHLCACVYVP